MTSLILIVVCTILGAYIGYENGGYLVFIGAGLGFVFGGFMSITNDDFAEIPDIIFSLFGRIFTLFSRRK